MVNNFRGRSGAYRKSDAYKPQNPAPSLSDLSQGFANDNLGIIVDDFAHKWAKWLAKDGTGRKNSQLVVKTTQLRRFYQDVKIIENINNTTSFKEVKPLIKMLKSKVAYAYAKDNVSKEFKELVNVTVDKAYDSEEQFNGFLKFFEALVGFHAMYGKN